MVEPHYIIHKDPEKQIEYLRAKLSLANVQFLQLIEQTAEAQLQRADFRNRLRIKKLGIKRW